MADRNQAAPYHTIIYLGAGARLPLEACRQAAANVWLVEASRSQAQKLRRAAGEHAGIKVEHAVVAAQSGTQTFHEYNLPWASGLNPPDDGLRRLYPGLRCLASESREVLGIGELVERCLAEAPQADGGQGALLVIDLAEQASELLQALEETGQLARFASVAVVPPYRQGVDLMPPPGLHGPMPLPEALAWLAKGSRCYQPHPLRERLQRAGDENRQLTQRLARLEATQAEREQQQQVQAAERDQLQQQLEERTQQRDELWHKSETLTQESGELKRQLEELAKQREDALHQNHLSHEALEAERELTSRLRDERDNLAREREAAQQQADHHQQQLHQEQQQRQQLVEQEMLKAEAQLDLIRDILTQGRDL